MNIIHPSRLKEIPYPERQQTDHHTALVCTTSATFDVENTALFDIERLSLREKNAFVHFSSLHKLNLQKALTQTI